MGEMRCWTSTRLFPLVASKLTDDNGDNDF